MSRYKRYPKYKDSGIEWIGEVPAHWSVDRLRYVAPFSNSNVDKKDHDGQQTVRLCNYTDVYNHEFVTPHLPFMQATASNGEIDRFALRRGDVLMTKDSEDPADIGIPAFVTEDMTGVICGYHLTVIRPPTAGTGRYLHRSIQSHPTKAYFFVESPGITRYGLSQDAIGDIPVCLPSPSEQALIAAVIDRETTRIDALIAKKTRFIELLKEKRQALITHAVTKGLDPNVKMKDSGVEWLGKVPEHWALMKFRRVATVTEGLVDPRVEPYASMPLFAPNHVESGTGRLLAIETASTQDARSGKYLCTAGSVVYCKIRPNLAKAIIAPQDGLCSADMYPLTCSALSLPEWLLYLILSASFTAWAATESDRVAMPKINRESLSELAVAIPPVHEQAAVASAIDHETARIDRLVAMTERSIVLIKERRAAFITAAVTGQIDLRNATPITYAGAPCNP